MRPLDGKTGLIRHCAVWIRDNMTSRFNDHLAPDSSADGPSSPFVFLLFLISFSSSYIFPLKIPSPESLLCSSFRKQVLVRNVENRGGNRINQYWQKGVRLLKTEEGQQGRGAPISQSVFWTLKCKNYCRMYENASATGEVLCQLLKVL